MYLTFFAQAASEQAPPSGWTATGEALLRHAETKPDVFFPILSVVLAVGVPLVLVGAALRFWLPRWEAQAALDRESRERQAELSRQHAEKLLAARGKEAAEDLAAAAELSATKSANLTDKIGSEVSRVSGSVEKLHEKLDKHGEALARVAAGLAAKGLGVLLLVLAIALGAHQVRLALAAPAIRCDPPCSAGQRCTKDGCREVKTTTAARPTSALRYKSFASLAGSSCQANSTACP